MLLQRNNKTNLDTCNLSLIACSATALGHAGCDYPVQMHMSKKGIRDNNHYIEPWQAFRCIARELQNTTAAFWFSNSRMDVFLHCSSINVECPINFKRAR